VRLALAGSVTSIVPADAPVAATPSAATARAAEMDARAIMVKVCLSVAAGDGGRGGAAVAADLADPRGGEAMRRRRGAADGLGAEGRRGGHGTSIRRERPRDRERDHPAPVTSATAAGLAGDRYALR
jgi:hypothetical protein